MQCCPKDHGGRETFLLRFRSPYSILGVTVGYVSIKKREDLRDIVDNSIRNRRENRRIVLILCHRHHRRTAVFSK